MEQPSTSGLQQQEGPGSTSSIDQELAAAVTEANDLLISSLSVGDHPTTNESELDAQIAAYRASITRLAAQLGPDAAADAAAQPGSSRDQARSAAAAAAAGPSSDVVPGLGREGVDYQVGCAGNWGCGVARCQAAAAWACHVSLNC